MQIKAQGLLNAAEWIEETYGPQALAEVVQSCRSEVRDRFTTAIAIEWHPMDELVDFLRCAEAVLPTERKFEISEAVGAAGARKNTAGQLKRFAFYIVRHDYALKRIAGMWRQFNDAGAMHLRELDEGHALIEVSDVPSPEEHFCATLTGWCVEVTRAVGLGRTTAVHSECRARGDARCVWDVTWRNHQSQAVVRPD